MLVVIDHFTYHVPGSQDDGPGPDMATSTTSGGVQSFSTRLKMMHVLHERREKHQRWVGRKQGKNRSLLQQQQEGTPRRRNAHQHVHPNNLTTPEMKTNALTLEEKAGLRVDYQGVGQLWRRDYLQIITYI